MPKMDASERKLRTEELLNLPQTVAVLIDHVAQMQGDLTALLGTTRQILEITQNLVVEMRQGF
jgi:hypothetical protein